jgi:hypothetical protein
MDRWPVGPWAPFRLRPASSVPVGQPLDPRVQQADRPGGDSLRAHKTGASEGRLNDRDGHLGQGWYCGGH